MPNPTRRAVALAVLVAAIVAAAVALDLAPVAAQSDEQTGRIVAQRLADGRTEFGWQPTGDARVLPSARYFPADAQVGRWLNSSAVEVGGAEIGRINARVLADGRIEFGFTPTDGERIEPRARYFPVDARVGRWLRSTEITISAAPAATGFVAVSAGGGHSCAIRAGSGAIKCWGANTGPSYQNWNEETGRSEEIITGQTDAPTGSFTAVSAGDDHTCAIRARSGAIECWGSNRFGLNHGGQTDAPAGSFSAVAAGDAYTCGLRESGAIECWGRNGAPDAPSGRFTAVSAGLNHACGLRESGAIECWGSNWFGQADAPAGRFSAVAAGAFHACGLRTGGAIECWGEKKWGATDAPAGRFTAVSAGQQYTCAIRESGEITCWSDISERRNAPLGRFTAVSAGLKHTCGLRTSGAIECWGNNYAGQADAPTP